MKKYLIILILMAQCFIQGQEKDSITFRLNQYFTALSGIKNFNGTVIIAKNSKILLNKAYNIEGIPDSLCISKNSRFIIASVSKVFIKFSILKLAELNKLSLNDTIGKFIPGFPAGNKITVEQLMYHKSGLPRELTGYEEYSGLTLTKVVEAARKEKLQFEPGSSILYSNVGYFLLHYIISKTAKEGYPLFTQNLLKKIGLTNTGEFNALNNLTDFAWGFGIEKDTVAPVARLDISRFETGNYYSTVYDMYKFSDAVLSGSVLKKEYALKMFGQDSVLMQAGGRPGYRAFLYKNLKTKIDFIFLSNFSGVPFQQVTADVINILENKPYKIPVIINRVKINLPGEILKKYTGAYVLEADNTQIFTVELDSGRLFISDGTEKLEINPDSVTTFFDNPHSSDGYVFFLNAGTGKYEMKIISSGVELKTTRSN